MSLPSPPEKLFFMHIPKTAGTSFLNLLEGYLSPNFYGLSVKAPIEESHQNFDVNRLQQKDFIAGHWDMGLLNQSQPLKLLPLTFFRHPLERTVSQYIYSKNTLDLYNEKTHNLIHRHQFDLLQLLEYDPLNPDFWNPQATQLAGIRWSQPDLVGDEEQVLALALENFKKLIFVGLSERFAESLLILCAQFQWVPPHTIPKLNVAKASPPPLSSATLAAIQRSTRLDALIYEQAKAIYNQHLMRLLQDLLNLDLPIPSYQFLEGQNIYAKRLFHPPLLEKLHAQLTHKAL